MNSFKPLLLAAAALLAACAAPVEAPKSTDIRTAAAFADWRARNEPAVAAFEAMLKTESVQGLVPLHELLRSASDWQKCNADPFAVPPETQWADAASVLRLLKLLKAEGALNSFEVHSGYRNAELNACAGGAARSSHLRAFAVDFTPVPASVTALCGFWKEKGADWKMGLGQYPTGRIHVDTTGYRTWGRDGSSKTSPCLPPAEAKPAEK